MRNPPDGHILITDDDYIIKIGDYYWYENWSDEIEKWELISNTRNSYMIGTFIKYLHYKQWDSGKISKFIIATKGKIEPRFKCEKPYPYGY